MRKTRILAIISACCLTAASLSGCSMDSLIEGKEKTVADPIEASNVTEGFYIRTAAGEYYKPTTSCTSYKKVDGKSYTTEGRYVYSISDKKFIPTVYADDSLIFVSSDAVPKALYCEEFEDLGYSIGMVGLSAGSDGNVPVTIKSCLSGSSAETVLQKVGEKKSYSVYAINGTDASKIQFSQIGTINGLEQGEDAALESYVGTFYKKLSVKADTHYFAAKKLSSVKSFSLTKDGYILIDDRPAAGYYDINCEGLIHIVDENRPVPTDEEKKK